ncbi:MAG: hypothetical protein II983_02650 [Firmicutes bacterium]|nr:hypothetical protein [Bacillota bacterium]MBQ4504546.1 hypothetical protein [Bacillota bacterium]MBQ6686326.1 hypothetical protein [Bacillota bacterium]
MKHKRMMVFVLAFMMLFSTIVSAAASDPAVTIISPVVESVVNSDSLLVSIKITQPETIRVSVYEEKQMVGEELVSVDVSTVESAPAAPVEVTPVAPAPVVDGTAATEAPAVAAAAAEPVNATASGVTASFVSQEVMAPETFTCTNTLSFYTKQINNVTPGLYKVKVDTINEAGEVLYSTETLVVVKGVASEAEKTDLFESNQSGISQFLQNLLKNIFG